MASSRPSRPRRAQKAGAVARAHGQGSFDVTSVTPGTCTVRAMGNRRARPRRERTEGERRVRCPAAPQHEQRAQRSAARPLHASPTTDERAWTNGLVSCTYGDHPHATQCRELRHWPVAPRFIRPSNQAKPSQAKPSQTMCDAQRPRGGGGTGAPRERHRAYCPRGGLLDGPAIFVGSHFVSQILEIGCNLVVSSACCNDPRSSPGFRQRAVKEAKGVVLDYG